MKKSMLAAVKTKPAFGSIELKEVPIPAIRPDEVLIKVKVASICGTDAHIYNWDEWSQKRIKPPLILGHEFAGEVVEAGRDTHFVRPGDYVSAEGHIACGHCFQCRTGLAHVCQNVKIIGVDRDGVFAQFVALPESNILKNDKDIPPELATIQDPFGNAVHAVFSADVPGHNVAIFGLGPIGLMSVALCRAIGAAKIFAIDLRNEFRLNLARQLRPDFVLRAEEGVEGVVARETKGEGVDCVLEMSGSGAAVNQGLKVVKAGGGIYLLGIYPGPVEIDLSRDVVFKAVKIHGINGRLMYQTWYRMAGLLKSPSLNLKPIITHRYKFEDFLEAIEVVKSGNCGKVVLHME